jgi:hypothetical protein
MKGPEVAEEPKPTITRTGKMPIIDPSEWDLDNVPDLKILPAGSEVRLRILEVIIKPDTSGNEMLMLRLDVADEPMVKEIYWNCHVPGGRAFTEKRNITLKRILSDMFSAFEFDKSATNDTADWLGKEAWAILSVVPPSEDGKYSEKNDVARWLAQK